MSDLYTVGDRVVMVDNLNVTAGWFSAGTMGTVVEVIDLTKVGQHTASVRLDGCGTVLEIFVPSEGEVTWDAFEYVLTGQTAQEAIAAAKARPVDDEA